MTGFQDYWDKTHQKYVIGRITYDNWLDKYKSILNRCKTKILDLGCGTGNDTLYLVEKGFEVVACDYSKVALEKLNTDIKGVETVLVDISQGLPFEDATFDLVIADLSLHYFDEKTTCKIMQDIKRILNPNGVLLARVNSVNDVNHGAGQGEKLEDNFYHVEGYDKRFFSIEDAEKFFSIIGLVRANESQMLRYEKPKTVVEVLAEKQEILEL